MTDTLPDRLSVDPHSPHYDADLLEQLSSGTELTRQWLAVAIASSSEIG